MATTTVSQPLADNSSFRMIDVGEKPETRRRAVAQGVITLSYEAFVALRDGKNPKGNVLALAEVAGIQAAKKTPDLIPLCHPLPLSSVRLEFKLDEASTSVTVFCEARATASTGVEMEALAGVNGALLTIYDLSKAVNPELTISEIRLNVKEGGKSGHWFHPKEIAARANTETSAAAKPEKILKDVKVMTLTVSDSVSQGKSLDKSGQELFSKLQDFGCEVKSLGCVADDIKQIQQSVMTAIETYRPSVLITTGGTGLSPRDVTPEALQSLCTKIIPGFSELLRQDGSRHIKTAWLSRSFAGIIQNTIVIALPGSTNAVREGLEVLAPLLPHALHTMTGARHV